MRYEFLKIPEFPEAEVQERLGEAAKHRIYKTKDLKNYSNQDYLCIRDLEQKLMQLPIYFMVVFKKN